MRVRPHPCRPPGRSGSRRPPPARACRPSSSPGGGSSSGRGCASAGSGCGVAPSVGPTMPRRTAGSGGLPFGSSSFSMGIRGLPGMVPSDFIFLRLVRPGRAPQPVSHRRYEPGPIPARSVVDFVPGPLSGVSRSSSPSRLPPPSTRPHRREWERTAMALRPEPTVFTSQ
jgi:hypothetical protein